MLAGKFDELELAHLDYRTLDDDTLQKALSTLSMVAFYAPYRLDIIRSTVVLSAELDRRGLSTRSTLAQTYRLLLNARDFEQAERFRLRHSDMNLPAFPPVVDHTDNTVDRTAPTALWPNPSERVVERARFDLNSGLVVLLIGGPGCSWLDAAVAAIARDELLRETFDRYGAFLIPQTSTPHPDSLFELAQSYWFPLGLIDQWPDWPMITEIGSPSFYVFFNGELIQSTSGWGGIETKNWLTQALSPYANAD